MREALVEFFSWSWFLPETFQSYEWENPLLMVFAMQPPPQIVFFMTDGAVGGRDMMKLTNDLAAAATENGIVVNTIAMMEPKANRKNQPKNLKPVVKLKISLNMRTIKSL
jgi:hypothetical protein